MGAWIETYLHLVINTKPTESHPMWVRGLKLNHIHLIPLLFLVAPYVGAWIETCGKLRFQPYPRVAPYVGAWIETDTTTSCKNGCLGRTLCGCVD